MQRYKDGNLASFRNYIADAMYVVARNTCSGNKERIIFALCFWERYESSLSFVLLSSDAGSSQKPRLLS